MALDTYASDAFCRDVDLLVEYFNERLPKADMRSTRMRLKKDKEFAALATTVSEQHIARFLLARYPGRTARTVLEYLRSTPGISSEPPDFDYVLAAGFVCEVLSDEDGEAAETRFVNDDAFFRKAVPLVVIYERSYGRFLSDQLGPSQDVLSPLLRIALSDRLTL